LNNRQGLIKSQHNFTNDWAEGQEDFPPSLLLHRGQSIVISIGYAFTTSVPSGETIAKINFEITRDYEFPLVHSER